MKVNKRLFVVGCARSGTTLVQAMLSSHEEIHGFPETFFFLNCPSFRSGNSPRDFKKYYRQAYYAFVEAMDRLGERTSFLSNFQSPDALSRRFLLTLDNLALAKGKAIWSEKTPGHINRINFIRRMVPQALFVHVIRDGRDVVASLEHLYRQKITAGESQLSVWPLSESIQRWNDAMRISLSCSGDPQHLLINYEELLKDPPAVLKKFCDFADIDYSDSMKEYRHQSSNVLGQDINDSWRRDVLAPLRSTHLVKYNQLFNTAEKSRVEDELIERGRVENIIA